MKLYEIDHPYYCTEGCYFVHPTECHVDVASWADFKFDSGWHTTDDDLNLLYRWDWNVPDPSDYKDGESLPSEQLRLYFMLQRKAKPYSVYVNVSRADEPEIREWLQKKWDHLQRLWEPLAPVIPVEASAFERLERTSVHYAELAKAARP